MCHKFTSQPFSETELRSYTGTFKKLDTASLGSISRTTAKDHLARYNIPPSTITKIYDLADPDGVGELDQYGFASALRLVGHVQSGSGGPNKYLLKVAGNIATIGTHPNTNEADPTSYPSPQLSEANNEHADTEILPQYSLTDPYANISTTAELEPETELAEQSHEPYFTDKYDDLWVIHPQQRVLYDEIFGGIQKDTVSLTLSEVSNFITPFNLSKDVQDTILYLADTQNNGRYSKDEFAIVMFLYEQSLSGVELPDILPLSLLPDEVSALSSNNWIIPQLQKIRFRRVFRYLDDDSKGVLALNEIMPYLRTSNLPQKILSDICWLTDVDHSGNFNEDEFAVILFLMQQIKAGIQLPDALPRSLFSR